MCLVGHVRIELSRLVATFLNALQGNIVEVEVCGKRKCEVGPVIPGIFKARTKSKVFVRILHEELMCIKDTYTHFEFKYEQSMTYKQPYLVNTSCK